MGRDAASRESVHAHRRPGGHRKPALRHYGRTRGARMPSEHERWQRPRRSSCAGPEANKPPRWSAERRASPGAQTVKASLRGDARAYVTGPLTNGCRCTRAPVGAPLPSLVERDNWQTSEEICLARRMTHARFVARHEAKRNAGSCGTVAPDFAELHPGCAMRRLGGSIRGLLLRLYRLRRTPRKCR